VFVSAKVSAQVYQEMPQYGYRANRMAFDSTLQIPTVCGVPTLKSIVKTNKSGAIAYDSCNARFYAYNPKTLTWTAITSGSADTTSLSNRINLKIDSLKRSNDSVYAYRNGTRVFQFKDSVGGGGSTPTLQQVTTQGSTTTIGISVPSINIGNSSNALSVSTTNESLTITTPSSDELLYVKNNVGAGIKFGGAGQSLELLTYSSGNVTLQTPSTSGTIALTSDTTNKFVNRLTRTIGKDSIIYFVGGNRFAIKDSVGTNPAPVGYYGAFQDTTTQTAVSINTAYGVKLGVTDLSNGVTISNNTRIKIANAGIYNIQFSLQLEKTGGSGNMIADIWLRKNNVNLAGTNGKIVLTGSANASPIVAAWNYVVSVSSNDSLELMWATDNLNVKIISDVATSPHPSTPSAILTVTQQSGIMAGTGISPLDTANMLSPYLRKIDTLSLSNRINLKLNISDTSTLQPKSISSYSILANNTSATANVTAQQFRDTSGVYNGTITWTGTTAPSGATNHSYRLTQVGKCVTLHIALVYASNGAALTAVTLTLPSGAPTPVQPTGLTGASSNMYPVNGQLASSANNSILSAASRGFLRNNAAGNGFDILLNFGSIAPGQLGVTVQYWTN
jgi:hypothetical protein